MLILLSNSNYDYQPSTSLDRAEIRTMARDYLYELSSETRRLWTDDQLNRWIVEEIHSWFGKKIYKRAVYEGTTEENATDFELPEGVISVEKIEIDTNDGAAPANWQEVVGWRRVGAQITLRDALLGGYPIRLILQKQYIAPSADGPSLEITDAEVEVLVHGVALRAYRALMGYFVDAKNWGTVAKPDGVSFNQVQNWYRIAKEDYKEMVKNNQKTPWAKDIDLVN